MNVRTLLLTASTLALQPLLTTPAAAEDWETTLTPYLWAFGIDGDIKAQGEEFNTSTDFSDIVDNLDFGGSFMLEANKGTWVNFLQLDYLSLSNGDIETRATGVEGRLEFDSTLAAVATGYRVTMSEKSSIDVLVGLRYANLDAEARIKSLGLRRESENDQYDGILMLRPRIALSKYWSFSPTLSAGAGDSDLTWELSPEVVYTNDCCNLEFRAGYRNLNYELENGNDELDISLRGPMIGLGFKF